MNEELKNFAKTVIDNGGKIRPLIVPFELSHGTGQTNPSILLDGENILVNLRCVQYVILHAENTQEFSSRWGPLAYMNPESDRHLTTTNFILKLDNDLSVIKTDKVDTSKLDVTPLWEFIGLEDVRLTKWNDKYWACGVRRDTTDNGEGRMEMSEIEITSDGVKEINRYRIQPPVKSYCEKNWMPVLDKPFHFVKWTNPTEVVEVDIDTLSSKTVHLSADIIPLNSDLRGGSSVIHWGDKYYAVVHDVYLFNNELGQKDAFYWHRFVVWDEDFNLIRVTKRFNFMQARVEFCCGLAITDDKVLMTFGYQDNCAYIMEMPFKFWEDFVWNN
jgi:hypothetical protein